MKSYRFFSALALAAGLLLGLTFLFSGTGGRVSAEQGITPTLPTIIPANDPERGLIYDGLARDPACARGYRIPGANRCTHGPDMAPFNLNVRESVAPQIGSASRVHSFQCDGDGSTGYRLQVLYVRASDKADRYTQYADSFRGWLDEMDLIYRQSAAETGGARRVRFVHGPDCVPTIDRVTVPIDGDDLFGTTIQALQNKGYNRTDRKYLIFMDANVYCGIGTLSLDDSPDQSNWNNSGPDWGRTDAGCWGASVPAHELNHNLGGVQDSAPNSTAHQNSGGHCSDEYDRMCYADASGVQMYSVCPDREHDRLLDCNHDDYFHTNPPPGNYLATHWNTASSRFLRNILPTCFPVLTVTAYPPVTPVNEVTVKWTLSGVGCSVVRHTDIHWDTVPRTGEHSSHYRYSNYGWQEQSGGLGEYQATVYLSDDVVGIPPNIYFAVHAFLDDAGEVISPEYIVAFSNASQTSTPTPSRTASPTFTRTNTAMPTQTATPTVTPTSTALLTATPTQTATLTVTPIACDTTPSKPKLLSPDKNTILPARRVLLDWADSSCADRYEVEVRMDSKTGEIVQGNTNLVVSNFKVKKLKENTTYLWQVRACNAVGCVGAKWRKFWVDLP